MPLGLIGKKLGHARVYDASGVITPVTVVLAGPNRVLQIRTPEKNGYSAVQLAFGDQKPQRLLKSALGELVKCGVLEEKEKENARAKGEKNPVTAIAKIREFRNFPVQLPVPEKKTGGEQSAGGDEKKQDKAKKEPETREIKPGDLIGVNIFAPGDFVDAIGVTKGRGFEGVVKRYNFRGGDSTHGAKGWHRRSGAIGQRLFPGTVMRGMKMPGHMGQVRRTTQNLEVIQVREADNLLLIKGSMPGAEGDYVIIRESKKRPKGWKPPVSVAMTKKGETKRAGAKR